ncbi:hypothetical protein [Mycoplasma sp. E35C]|uniref:hypothetical protein n=1 Tax=Mycoplasma sp. E35C TaxID=2801918 RepID=UPI001CA3F0B8|nr:hypothetical protein [Mycoplasma sp. E35C]QZX49099.1 hypothetical protein JJE79_03545 [Mycoplasma sp. E35C]
MKALFKDKKFLVLFCSCIIFCLAGTAANIWFRNFGMQTSLNLVNWFYWPISSLIFIALIIIGFITVFANKKANIISNDLLIKKTRPLNAYIHIESWHLILVLMILFLFFPAVTLQNMGKVVNARVYTKEEEWWMDFFDLLNFVQIIVMWNIIWINISIIFMLIYLKISLNMPKKIKTLFPFASLKEFKVLIADLVQAPTLLDLGNKVI